MVYKSMLDLVGNTPLLKADLFAKEVGFNANLFLKLEVYNPAGSVKDRISFAMIEDLEKRKIINKDTILIEATSGNTGIGLAFVCAVKGYKLVVIMPDTMSKERRKLVKAYGAEIILTDGTLGMKGAIEKAKQLRKQTLNSCIPSQFTNPANPMVHYETTGPEVWKVLDKKVDVFVAGVGTGGAITGVGKFLKEKNKDIKCVAIEPLASAVISGNLPGKHKIQGIGAGFLPEVLDLKVIDFIQTVSNEKAFETSALLAKTEGFLVGISSGAVIAGAMQFLSVNPEYENKNIVCLLADGGERYLSTELFD